MLLNQSLQSEEHVGRAEMALATMESAALLGRDSSGGLVSFHLKRLLGGATGVSVAPG